MDGYLAFSVVFWPVLTLCAAGFILGSRGPAWSRWIAVFGLPGVVASIGTWRALVAESEPDPASYVPISESVWIGVLTAVLSIGLFLCLWIGVMAGEAWTNRRRRHPEDQNLAPGNRPELIQRRIKATTRTPDEIRNARDRRRTPSLFDRSSP